MESLPSDDLRTHLVTDAIKRRWPIIFLTTLLLTVAVGGYAYTQVASYTAVAKVLVRPIPGNPLSNDSTTNSNQVTVAMETEASLVNSPQVTEIANDDLETDVVAGSPSVNASVPTNTEVVQIEYTSPSAESAQRGAQTFAEAFLQFRGKRADATVKYQLDSLEKQAKAAQDSLKSASLIASGTNPPPDAASQVQLYASRLAALQASIGQLQTQDTQPGDLVTPAKVPDTQSGLDPIMLVIAAALLGLFGGLALAIWRERNDDRIRAASETSLLGIPVLASVPHQHHGPHLIADPATDERARNAYRRARTGILAVAQSPTVLVVSAVIEGEPVGEVAANLALSLGRSGHRVVLVDASVEPNEISQSLHIDAAAGLSDLVNGSSAESVALSEMHGIRVLGAGTEPVAARERYSGELFANVLGRLRADADFVIVAAGAVSTADGGAVSLAGDSLVLVAADRHTTQEQVAEAADRAGSLGVHVLGAVVTCRYRKHRRSNNSSSAGSLPPEPRTPSDDRPGTVSGEEPALERPTTISDRRAAKRRTGAAGRTREDRERVLPGPRSGAGQT